MEAKIDRKLVAIMFTHIVGYTALMQTNEKRAFKQKARHSAVFQEQHELFDGLIIQYHGDGTLSVFNSVVKVSECAIQIQLTPAGEEIINLKIVIRFESIFF